MWIERLVQLVFPRQDRFYVLLEKLSERMTAAADAFGGLAACSAQEQFDAVAGRLRLIKTEAGRARQRFCEELDVAFVTPIDREDLERLATALHGAIAGMEDSAALAALCRLGSLTGPMRLLVGITSQAVGQLGRAVVRLRKYAEAGSIGAYCVAIQALENEADVVHRAAIGDLFAGDLDFRELVRQKDLLFALEAGVDLCEDAMDAIRSVVVKNG